ncbi:MAG TPA: serine/threonine-protein kinase [Enhygromyxa sp.]|nr:serine/threonine-protein kinase [Enhygromyxa sp.]
MTGSDRDGEHTRNDAMAEDAVTRPALGSLIEPTHALTETVPRQPGGEDGPAELAQVGRYRITDQLGRGGMGVVLHAYDPDLDRELAVKLLRERVDAPASQRGRSLLMQEARAIARLSHPNVIQIYDVGVHRGRVYLAMELVRGRPLHVWMRQGHPLTELLEVFCQAARGLAAAHRTGLVHRDFKPPNVLVGDDGRVRVVDFGLARLAADAEALEPAALERVSVMASVLSNGLAGTPAYMSPEQFHSADPDTRSDQFAFCVSLHEALFGARPFVGETLWELRDAVTRSPLTLPGSAEALPAELRALLHRGLAKHGADRFSSMDPIIEILEELRRTLLDDPDREPVLAPIGITSADPGTDPSLRSSKRLSTYLGTLPRGLDSHPQCLMHGAALRLALARHPLVTDDASRAALPVQVRASLEYLERADPEQPWLAEVPGRVLFAAIYDRHFRSRRAWDELWLGIARSRCLQHFVGFASVRPGIALWSTLARVWGEHHQGTTLAFEKTNEPSQVRLRLVYPKELLDELAHAEALQLVRAGLLTGGFERFEVTEREANERELAAQIRFG